MGLGLALAAQPANLLTMDRLDPDLAASLVSVLLAAWQVYLARQGRFFKKPRSPVSLTIMN